MSVEKLSESQRNTFENEIQKLKHEIDKVKSLPDEDLYDPPEESHKIDWLKISATDFKGIHSEENCRLMWSMVLHPSLSGGNFSAENLKRLIGLVEKSSSWDAIAKEMGVSKRIKSKDFLKRYISFIVG